MSEGRFAGRVALVTGAGRGMGACHARLLALGGARVVVQGRDGESVEQIATGIRTSGGEALAVAGDVSREEDVARNLDEAEAAFGPVGILVNNAGVASFGGTEAVTRVMIESADGEGRHWSTVGVSTNIIDASYNALRDSIVYKLFRDGAEPHHG